MELDIERMKLFVKHYEEATGIEAQNFRQRKDDAPETVYMALKSDIIWHLDHAHEMVQGLEYAANEINERHL